MSPARWFVAATLPLLAIGIALARGKKQVEEAPPPPPVETVVAAPPAPAAPTLFAAGLPVVLDQLPAGIASLSAQSCNACHWTAHDTWATSAHANAWADPNFRVAYAAAGNATVCVSCHLPVAAQHDQIAAAYTGGNVARPELIANPSFDAALMSEGVTCVACHVRDGVVLGTRTSARSPHPLVASTELSSSEMCATCHQLSWPEGDRPYYDTFGEWKASAYATAGVECSDCHMAPGAGQRQPGVTGFVASHGGDATLVRALTTLVKLERASITRNTPTTVGVTLINSGAGHTVPTGNPHKAYVIEVVLLDANGKELAPPHLITLRRTVEATAPYRTIADERIAAQESKTWNATFTPASKGAPGLGAVVVRARLGTELIELRRVSLDIK